MAVVEAAAPVGVAAHVPVVSSALDGKSARGSLALGTLGSGHCPNIAPLAAVSIHSQGVA